MTPDLKQFPLLVELSEEDRVALGDLLEPKSVVAGRSIFREGTEADGLVLIASGAVTVSAGRLTEPESFRAGEVLGPLSLVSVGPREATAVAETGVELLVLPRTSFRRLADDYPRTACRLIEAILRDFASAVRPSLDDLVP